MPAPTAADVARATRAAAVDTQSNAAVLTRQPGARDGLASPSPGFFDSIADAAAVNAARLSLIGTERRRFQVLVGDILEPAMAQVTPTVQLVDPTLSADLPALVARIEIDDAIGRTTLELFG